MVKNTHTIKLHTPFYADSTDGTMLHRYLDEKFIPRFLQEASSGQLTSAVNQAWRKTDSFGKHAGKLPTLRLPLHRTFHVVSCEVSCDMPGNPALDPKRILSAGMVIRRGTPQLAKSWKVRDGVSQGWQNHPQSDLEPNEYHRLLRHGLIRNRTPEPLYSGEETYPLHSQVITQALGNGQQRNRTLLYGYLPLGGSVDIPLTQREENTPPGEAKLNGQLSEHPWPFGCAESTADDCQDKENPIQDCCGHGWTQSDGLQIDSGIPQPALVQLLRTLIERYHIHEATISANEALRTALGQISLISNLAIEEDAEYEPALSSYTTHGNLLSLIDSNWKKLIDYFADADEEAREGDSTPAYHLLPGAYDPGIPPYDLYITRNQASILRDLLIIRAETAELQVAESLPIARFQQGEGDIYFVKPFIRYKDECDNEKITWGPGSKPFRVTSPFDPEAVRPSAIQLPELDDVKRGFAKGVTFITPKSIAEKMDQIKPDLELKKQSAGNLLSACFGLTISFSIPIITICAMILLMIIMQLLNIVFRWMPWAMLKLPKSCR